MNAMSQVKLKIKITFASSLALSFLSSTLLATRLAPPTGHVISFPCHDDVPSVMGKSKMRKVETWIIQFMEMNIYARYYVITVIVIKVLIIIVIVIVTQKILWKIL